MRTIRHQFVKYVPDVLEEGVLYITVEYATAVHRCFCGCGAEVVTPLSPTDWKLTFDGVSVTLYPSVGNWSLSCQSHYRIERNTVLPAPRWSEAEIKEGRIEDRRAKDSYYGEARAAEYQPVVGDASPTPSETPKKNGKQDRQEGQAEGAHIGQANPLLAASVTPPADTED